MSDVKSKKRSRPLKIHHEISELQPVHKKPVLQLIEALKSGTVETKQISKCLDSPKARRTSGYMLFVKDKRKIAQQRVGTNDKGVVPPKEVIKKLGEMWRALEDSNREAWNTDAKKQKLYIPKKKIRKPIISREFRSTSGYMLFTQEKRRIAQQNVRPNDKGVVPPKEVMKKLGQMWKELNNTAKEAYSIKAKSMGRMPIKRKTEKKPRVKRVKALPA